MGFIILYLLVVTILYVDADDCVVADFDVMEDVDIYKVRVGVIISMHKIPIMDKKHLFTISNFENHSCHELLFIANHWKLFSYNQY